MNLATQSSASSVDEIREPGRAFQSLIVGEKKLPGDFNSSAYNIIYWTYIRFIRHVYEYFLTRYINKMVAGSCNSIVISDIDSRYYVISGYNLRK